jgi:hypothetical protein
MMTKRVNGSLAATLLRMGMAVIVMGPLISCVAAERRGATAQDGSDSAQTSSDQAQAIQVLNTRCVMCHSTDLITQQRLGECTVWDDRCTHLAGSGPSPRRPPSKVSDIGAVATSGSNFGPHRRMRA